MNADKRSTHTDALETLGTIIGQNERRDAIHLAVEPSIAACNLMPGQDVGFVEGGVGPSMNPVGIVDPFLRQPVLKGERFWLVVYPRQITSLRHVWTHPAFPAAEVGHASAPSKTVSEQWIKSFAESADCPGYFELMAKAEEYCKYGETEEWLHFSGSDAHGDIPAEFWVHFEIMTGLKPQGEAPAYFSCSC